MKIRYSYKKNKQKQQQGISTNNNIDNVVNNKDVSAGYDKTASCFVFCLVRYFTAVLVFFPPSALPWEACFPFAFN